MIPEITEDKFYDMLRKDNISIDDIGNMLVNKLREHNKKLATAESCTGGMVSEKITNVSGASNVFDCGVCSYANSIKSKLLEVDQNVLNTVGAVSEETAKQMAKGVRKLAQSDFGVSTTGIAGPGGGTSEKPVGLVYIGFCSSDKNYAVKALLNTDGKNNRDKIRHLAVGVALYIVYKEV